MTPEQITLAIYNLALIPVVFFSVVFLVLSFLGLFTDKKIGTINKKNRKYPSVTVQIPSFNDLVAIRCAKACMAMRYPKNKVQYMIVDDSTDKKIALELKKFSKRNNILYIHRMHREGYKPGALRDAMPYVTGEIIVIFDADFIPKKRFLEEITLPFKNPKIGIVQARQGFLNADYNLVSKFASYLLMIHHTILMPINHRINTVFFCGTGGAIRKKAIEDAGGWNANSITEDSDLSIKILAKGYKNVYMKLETPSEVPITLEGFLKQQMRWTYGNIRVFIDHFKKIFFTRKFNIKQKLMISYMTMGPTIAPIILIMTLAGLSGWFMGDPQLFELSQLFEFSIKFFYTAGFLIMAGITLYKHKSLKEFPKLLLATFSVSIILAFANSVAAYKAIFMKNKELYPSKKNSWICTPKQGNANYLKK